MKERQKYTIYSASVKLCLIRPIEIMAGSLEEAEDLAVEYLKDYGEVEEFNVGAKVG